MEIDSLWYGLSALLGSHPWQGVSLGDNAPQQVTAFIEIVPTDTVKYELDKASGLLRVDRPQRYSNVSPCLYGLLPQTLCAERMAARASERAGRTLVGDGDPLDVCVLTERSIAHGNVLCEAVPIGGLRFVDGGEAGDKIIAVLHGDALYGKMRDVDALASGLLDRLRHYFLTYKQAPDDTHASCEIIEVYGQAEAFEVIKRSAEDYHERYSGLQEMLTAALRAL